MTAKINRRTLFGLLGAVAAAPLVPKLPKPTILGVDLASGSDETVIGALTSFDLAPWQSHVIDALRYGMSASMVSSRGVRHLSPAEMFRDE